MAITAVDEAFMGFYQQVQRNSRRAMRLMLALLPLVLLLVGSCKTSDTAANTFTAATPMAQFRAALFPDRAALADESYRPASGYVARARDYIEGDPESLNRLTEDEVAYIFGKPDMERRDADARIWQYRAPGCVVDFFFYDQKPGAGSGARSAVSYVDFRLQEDLEPGSAARMAVVPADSQSACLDKIAR